MHHHTHKFEAANATERDAWLVAIEKEAEEGKGMKEEVTGRESYKKTLDGYCKFMQRRSPTQLIDR